MNAAAPPRIAFPAILLMLLVGTARTNGCRISTGIFDVVGSAAIEVITSTTGADTDPDGYTAVITDELERVQTSSIGTDDRVRFTDLEGELSYRVELTGVAANCEIVGEDAVDLFLAADATASVSFDVECGAVLAIPGT